MHYIMHYACIMQVLSIRDAKPPEFSENKPTPDFSAFSIQNWNYRNLKLILKI